MTARLVSALAFSISLVACGAVPSTPDSSELPDAPVAPDGSGSDGMPASGFELTTETLALSIVTGGTSSLDVRLIRHAPFTGAVTLTISGLPPGVTAEPITVGPDQTDATFELAADTNAAHTLPTPIVITGSADSLRATTTTTLTVQGPPGTLDQSFMAGTHLLPVGAGDDYAQATVVQPDGKILIAGSAGGDFALVRLDRDGALDPTFGNAGKVITDFGGNSDSATAIALQPDGKILVAGTSIVAGTSYDFAVARYNADGSLDTTFSGDGKLTTPVGTGVDFARAVVVQADGKIVLGGDTTLSSYPVDIRFALVRYLPDGRLDTSFGGTGIVVTQARPSYSYITALALQQVGGEQRIVAVGGDGDFVLARYRANGQLDTTFGTNGLVTSVFQSTVGTARAIAPSGQLFVAGHINHHVAVAAFTSAGEIAQPFGKSITAISAGSDEAQAIVLDGDRPLVAGWAHQGATTSPDVALVRLMPDGTLDTSFGGGKIVTPLAAAGQPDQATGLALQVDPRVPTVRAIVVGYATASNVDFAVARYWR